MGISAIPFYMGKRDGEHTIGELDLGHLLFDVFATLISERGERNPEIHKEIDSNVKLATRRVRVWDLPAIEES